MRIRPERELEFQAIDALVRTAFETAKVADGDESAFVARMRRSAAYIPDLALLAEAEGLAVAYIMLTRTAVSTPAGPEAALLLAALCVALPHRRQGVARRLIGEALRRAHGLGYRALLVVGDPAYYGRFGFRSSSAFGIRNANGFADEHVMALALAPGGLSHLAGCVELPT